MSFEDELKQIKKRAGVNEAGVDTSFLGRRQEQMAQDSQEGIGRIQAELQTKLKVRHQIEARLVTLLAEEVRLQIKRAMLLHPEAMSGMSEEEAIRDYVSSGNFQKNIDTTLTNLEMQILDMLTQR